MKAAGVVMRRIKRALLTVSVVGVFMIVWVAGALALPNPFLEVPSNHWTYGALERLSAIGLNTRVPEGVRRFGWQLTRVEMALEVAAVLERLAAVGVEEFGDGQGGGNATQGIGLTWNVADLVERYNRSVAEDMQITIGDQVLLENLVSYFRSDLEALGYRVRGPWAVGADSLPDLPADYLPGQLSITGTGVLRYNEFVSQLPQSTISGSSVGQNYSLNLGYIGENVRLNATVLTRGTQLLRESDGSGVFALTSLEFAYDDRMVARIGDLSDHAWSDLALNPNHPLQGLQAGIQIGRLGSTVLFAHSKVGGEDEYLAGLDGTLYLDRITLGVSLLHSVGSQLSDGDSRGETVASLQGTYRLTPGLLIMGGLAGNVWSDRAAGAIHLAGRLQYSERLSVAANFRMQDQGFQRILSTASGQSGRAFDLEFDIGQTQLRAGIGRSEWGERDESGSATTTTLGFRYPVTDLAFLRAETSRSVYDGGRPDERNVFESLTTSVGLDFLTPRMNVSLGYALEELWGQGFNRLPASRIGEAELEYRLSPYARALAGLSLVDEQGVGQRLTTGFGIDYDVLGGSFSFRYEVVDFSGMIDSEVEESRIIGAEFTIRF